METDGAGAGDDVARPRVASDDGGPAPTGGRGRLVVVVVLALLVGASTLARVRAALGDPNFDAESPVGLLKSDPALLWYLTGRVLDAGGGVPADWRADPRIQHPYATDVPAEFTVGQEFLLAWTQLALERLGRAPPMHVTALWLFGLCASLALVGVYGCARELTWARTRSPLPALFAALLWVLMPASYRTIGFVLVREDVALPALAAGLWLVARAARVGTARAWGLAGMPLAVALATWHASGFFCALLLVAPLAWLLRTGESAFERRGAPWVLAAPVAACLFVPALRAAGTLASLPALLTAALLGAGFAARRGARAETRLAVGLGLAGVVLVAAGTFAGGEPGAYAHVHDVLLAKLRHHGVPPADPDAVSFDARLLWQGPFETLAPVAFVHFLGFALLFAAISLGPVWLAWGPGGPARARAGRVVTRGEALVTLAALVSLPAAWLVARVVVLPGLLLPLVAALYFTRLPSDAARIGLGAPILLLQAWRCVPWLATFASSWYVPPGRQAEIAALVEWVADEVPEDAAIAADFMNGTALLAHCGTRNVLQPKYETDRSRRMAERFLATFFHGSPAEFQRLVREEFRATHFLVDRYTLGVLSRWTAGLAADEPLPRGSAAELFLSQDARVLEGVAGSSLVYRSPPTILQSNGRPYDLFRLYRLEPLGR